MRQGSAVLAAGWTGIACALLPISKARETVNGFTGFMAQRHCYFSVPLHTHPLTSGISTPYWVIYRFSPSPSKGASPRLPNCGRRISTSCTRWNRSISFCTRWFINTLDECFQQDMDGAVSIEQRLAAMQAFHSAGGAPPALSRLFSRASPMCRPSSGGSRGSAT